MKFWIASGVFVVASFIVFFKLPSSRFMAVEVLDLASFYIDPQQEIKNLYNHYPAEDMQEAKRWIAKYKMADTNTQQYIFNVTDALRQFENGEITASENYGGRVFESIKNSKAQNINTDCGQFTDFVSVFMMAGNVPFRRIDAHGIPDTAIGAHSFQEIFIQEKQQWAFLDITNDKILLHDEAGNFLTVADVFTRVKNQDFSGVGIYSFSLQNKKPIPWAENIKEEKECFDPSIMLLYYTTNDVETAYNGVMRFRRYFLFYDWVRTFHNPHPTNNFWYFTRLAFLYMGVLLGLVAISKFVVKLFSRPV